MKWLLLASATCLAIGCASDTRDDSMYLTGTEEYAVQNADGEYVCESPKKVLICHIPPGNPDNAHTICVGAPAVEPHQERHGDSVGACDDGAEEPPPPEEMPPEESEPDAGHEDPPTDPPVID